MKYKQSGKILKKIKTSEHILINCHRDADPDSVGSATALYQVLKRFNKKIKIISPNEPQRITDFIPHSEKIEIIDFRTFEFKDFDLLIIIDSGSPQIVTGDDDIPLPKTDKIILDHHATNTINHKSIKIIDPDSTSATQLLYNLFKQWDVKLNRSIAKSLLAGLVADSGAFQFPNVGVSTFQAAADLMSYGVDKNEVIVNIYRNEPFELLKFWGEVLKRLKMDKDRGFIWSAVPYGKFLLYGKPDMGRRTSVERFGTLVEGTKFGIVMVEQEKRKLVASFRSRTGFDTTKITKRLGGGGHIYASGCEVKGLTFRKAMNKVLSTARKVAEIQE